MVTQVDIRRDWDRDAFQTRDITALGGHTLLITWSSEPPIIDAAVPESVAAVLSSVLVGFGVVAFRWLPSDAPPLGNVEIVDQPDRGLLAQARAWARGGLPIKLVTTRDARSATQLFDFDWDMQGQTVLVLEDIDGNTSPALKDLRERREWDDVALEKPVLALMAPAVDGDGAVITARTAEIASTIEQRLSALFARTPDVQFREAASP